MAEALVQDLEQMTIGELVEVEWAYHVTKCLNNGKDSKPTWSELRWSLADDPDYDDSLLGFPCVFLTTTLWRGGLPTMSMYPRNGKQDENYWRVAIPLKHFNDYNILYCHQIPTSSGVVQIKLVLAEPNLAERLPWQQDSARAYLRREQNGEDTKWYSNEYQKKQMFVNIAILGDFVLPDDIEWTPVKHTAPMQGSPNRPELVNHLISAMKGHPDRVQLADLLISAMTEYPDRAQLAKVFISAMEGYPDKIQLVNVLKSIMVGYPDKAQLADVVISAMVGYPDRAQFADVVISAMKGHPDRVQLADALKSAMTGYPDNAQLARVFISAMEGYPDKAQLAGVLMLVMEGSPDRAQLANELISAMINLINLARNLAQ